MATKDKEKKRNELRHTIAKLETELLLAQGNGQKTLSITKMLKRFRDDLKNLGNSQFTKRKNNS